MCSLDDETLPVVEEAYAPSPVELLVGRYAIGEILGRGGSGQVHRARDTLTGEAVAVKFLRSRDPAVNRQLRRELTALRLLDMPGVVGLRDQGVDEGQPFLVMDLLPGGRLDRLSGPWSQVRPALITVFETIARVHQAGVLHRDLKPGNILLDAESRPVITDFGLAQGRAIDTRCEDRIEGTPRYMAPEQRQLGQVDHRSDLYALGGVAWELVTGRQLPPDREARLAGLERADVPDSVRRVIASLLHPDPEHRPTSANEVLVELGGPSTAQVPELGPTVRVPTLRALFAERTPTFLHVADGAADLLGGLSAGRGDVARAVLERWIRSGRVVWQGNRAHLRRADLAALQWETDPMAADLARAGLRMEGSELAAVALDSARRAHREGRAPRAVAILESVLPALPADSPAARSVLHELTSEALSLADVQAVRHALYRAERAGDRPVVQLLDGVRLCLTGEMARAEPLLSSLTRLPDGLETWRIGYLAHALGRLDTERQAEWLERVHPWCAREPDRLAKWCSWSGTAAYARGEYATALMFHEQAIAAWSDRPVELLSVLNNGAAAALEIPDLHRARALAQQARAQARSLGHGLAEGRATWIERAAAYRQRTPFEPDPGLAGAGAELSPMLEAQLALTDAASAWRASLPIAASLARRAADGFGRLRFRDGQALALALAVDAGDDVLAADARSALADTRHPTLGLQALALVGAAPVVSLQRARQWQARWHLPEPDQRADVLCLRECLERIERSTGHRSPARTSPG